MNYTNDFADITAKLVGSNAMRILENTECLNSACNVRKLLESDLATITSAAKAFGYGEEDLPLLRFLTVLDFIIYAPLGTRGYRYFADRLIAEDSPATVMSFRFNAMCRLLKSLKVELNDELTDLVSRLAYEFPAPIHDRTDPVECVVVLRRISSEIENTDLPGEDLARHDAEFAKSIQKLAGADSTVHIRNFLLPYMVKHGLTESERAYLDRWAKLMQA